ncbi:hypothetical protein Lfu02_02560 [Longispora fulva]|uniref:Diadenosine tetraphosphatase ApaH/serine/threonine PP2A family protein phosphatase n=1 Tax=Longispora fulva TaxID=619741 RepID=A0A8J7KVY0_9ACTN|nr:hypothetical protein [Longispora fulva]MBG6135872.1 diadenosine tetraphosphatase ApaH/serine/threonine PP2A family protein phosphatase [Longispora fulva]GIG55884.1 hypothetical protein Lfu02_02560 [Longispora fulva]
MSLDMNLDATMRAMNVLHGIADQLEAAWRTAGADVDWLTGALGKGPLGARFRAVYDPAHTAFQQHLQSVSPLPAALAAAGMDCVDVYATAEAHAVAELLQARFR